MLSRMQPVLARPRTRKVLAGVCDAVADRFGRRPGIVRVCFVLATPFFFWMTIPIYIALWIVIPLADE